MSMSLTKRNYLCLLTALAVLIGVGGGLCLYFFFPQHYFNGYPLIPIYYWTFGFFTISMTEMCRRIAPGKLLMMYLLLRGVRMIFSFLVMLLFCLAVRHEARNFLLTFVANYLLFIVFDTWFYATFELNKEMERKRKKKKEKTPHEVRS